MLINIQMENKYLPILKKRNPKSLNDCLDDFKKSWKELDKISRITENWIKLIGLELFKECKPLKIEKNILIIAVNHPQWRQALIYNKHRLKKRIEEIGIDLKEIKVVQNYELNSLKIEASNTKLDWDRHPSRIIKNKMGICKFCNCPTPLGEISRWDQCTFCWRKNR